MLSHALKDFLTTEEAGETQNRPHVSNNNPFYEWEFRTMKYRPNYSKSFTTLHEAQAFFDQYVAWDNGDHKHCGIALFSPNDVHDGSWRTCWQARDNAQQAYFQAHPERFRQRPYTPAAATIVGINVPPVDDTTQLDIARS
jgi:putative transposase